MKKFCQAALFFSLLTALAALPLQADAPYRSIDASWSQPSIAAVDGVAVEVLAVEALDAEILDLEMLDGEKRRAIRTDFERRAPRDVTWRGRFDAAEGTEGGRVVLTWKNGVLAGLMWGSDGLYQILPTANGTFLERIEQDLYPPCGADDPAVVATDGSLAGDSLAGDSPTGDSLADLAASFGERLHARSAEGVDPADQIDLMSMYTPQARDGAGGVAQIEATIQAAVDISNTAFLDSDMEARFRLVHTGLSTRNDTGSISSDLSWLRNDGDTISLRDEYRADMVSLITNTGGCGIAYVMRSPGPGFASSAFQVTVRGCAVGNLTFAHEHGHNMGFEHDPANGTSPGSASYAWSFGHFVDGSYRTVMSYSNQCTQGCTRVPHFSNPDVMHNGAPTGIANERDNHRSGNLTAEIVANFRDGGLFSDGFETGSTSAWSSLGP